MQSIGLQTHYAFEVNDTTTMLDLIQAGLGIGVLPRVIVALRPDLRCITIKGPERLWTIAAQTMGPTPANPAARALWDAALAGGFDRGHPVDAERAQSGLGVGDHVPRRALGREAERMGLVLKAVPIADLDAEVEKLAARMASMPVNQLMMQKLMINQALENMGLRSTQMIATLFDGITRHTPEGMAFKRRAETVVMAQGFFVRVFETEIGGQDFTTHVAADVNDAA